MSIQARTGSLVAALVFILATGPAAALDPGTSLKGVGGMDVGSLVSGSAGNAAGVIEYCIRNNYLSGSAVQSVKAGLLGTLGEDSPADEDAGFASGAKGLLQTADGKSVDLSRFGDMKKSLARKACDSVLEHARSFL